MDNCSSNNSNDKVQDHLRHIRTTTQKLPSNATQLVQPADYFIIQKIKEAWRSQLEAYTYECIKEGNLFDGVGGKCSGKLCNPGKSVF